MKPINRDDKDKLDFFNSRIDVLEQLIKMLLINSILDSATIDEIENEISKTIATKLKFFEITKFRIYTIDEQNLLFVYLDDKRPLKKIRELYAAIAITDVKVVLVFDKITDARKRKFEEEKISFSVRNQEIKVFE